MKHLLKTMLLLLGGMAGLLSAQTPAPLAYVSAINGQDAVIIAENSTRVPVYVTAGAQDMILTPRVSPSGKLVSFVLEGGQKLRELHRLALTHGGSEGWQGSDSLLGQVSKGSWPVCDDNGSCLLVMQTASDPLPGTASNVCEFTHGEITLISNNTGRNRYFWPLLAPDGTRLHYRVLTTIPGADGDTRSVRSIIYDRIDGTRTAHLIDRNVFIEQWTVGGELLVAERLNDGSGMRRYLLYDPETETAREIYQGVSWQARLSPDGRFLATLTTYPANGPNFDIFITDLENHNTVNFTQTPAQSESLIGWVR